MKRVAFFLQTNPSSWLGGLNYLQNLLTAICSNDDRRIEPVLFIHPAVENKTISNFPPIETIITPLVNPKHTLRFASRACYRLFNIDYSLNSLLVDHRIDVLSHSGLVGKKSSCSSISWIPDFQHRRLPQYFTKGELRVRDRQFMKMINESQGVVVSSYDAHRDLHNFAPSATPKSHILRFVSCIGSQPACLSRDFLFQKYKINRPFFLLPNQFWPHKNHLLVIDALGLLASRGINVLVLATGKTSDYRGPSYFHHVMDRAKTLGVLNHFRVLGMVPPSDLLSLMLYSVSLINPSKFEGWSTSVEESKSLGLPIVLSDIPVHLEQAPPLGRYFKVDSAEDLATALTTALNHYDEVQYALSRQIAQRDLPRRIKEFGRAYETIALKASNSIL